MSHVRLPEEFAILQLYLTNLRLSKYTNATYQKNKEWDV